MIKRCAALVMLAVLAGCSDDPEIEDQPIEPIVEPAAPGEETAPLPEMSAPVYVGVWAADPDWCGDAAPGSADPSPVAFTEAEFIGYENRCRIGAVEEGTEGGYLLEMTCLGEGIEYTETVEVDVDGEMLRMTREAAPEVIFTRCKEEE